MTNGIFRSQSRALLLCWVRIRLVCVCSLYYHYPTEGAMCFRFFCECDCALASNIWGSHLSLPVELQDRCGFRLALGASGGTRIITGVAQTLLNRLSFGANLSDAIERARFHHQLLPNVVEAKRKSVQDTSEKPPRPLVLCPLYEYDMLGPTARAVRVLTLSLLKTCSH